MNIKLEDNIIPNWFNKKHIEELTGKKLTKKKFQAFKEFCEDNMAGEVSNKILDYWEAFNPERLTE